MNIGWCVMKNLAIMLAILMQVCMYICSFMGNYTQLLIKGHASQLGFQIAMNMFLRSSKLSMHVAGVELMSISP